MSLRVATVFSGIGAIEHALERMGIEHDIVFACDNSNIDPFEKMTIRQLYSFSHRIVELGGSVKQLDSLNISDENFNQEIIQRCKEAILSIEDEVAAKTAVDELYGMSRRIPFVEQSYMANYGVSQENFHKDISMLNGKQYADGVDLFVGGSPCQSFSFVGHQGGFDDARGTLFYDFVRLVDEIKPKMFIWENVKGVYTHDGGSTWDVIAKCFDNTDYTWSHAILNSKDYGIPQHRQRVFVVGFLNGGENFCFPDPIELKLTMQDFLEDRVAGKYFLNTKGVDFVTWDKNHRKQYTQIDGEIMLCQKANQQFNWHGDFVFVEENNGQHLVDEKHFLSLKVEAYVMATGTKGFRSIPEIDLDVARPLLSTMHKNHRAGVDNYVTTEGRIRMLTPKECLRLMGFCDSFKQVVSNNQMYRQAGNSIVVDVLIAIMAQAIPVLAGRNTAFSNLQERANRVRELFDELPERQIQQSDLDRVVAALST